MQILREDSNKDEDTPEPKSTGATINSARIEELDDDTPMEDVLCNSAAEDERLLGLYVPPWKKDLEEQCHQMEDFWSGL